MLILYTLVIFLTVPISVHWRPPRSGLTLLGNPLNNNNNNNNKKESFPGSEFKPALYLDILDADRSPNAVSTVHAGTSQVDFEVDCPPPAACPPGDLSITMVKETVILYKKEFRKMKKSRISH